MRILVVNAGSSSIKFAVFDGTAEVVAGRVTEIGGAGRVEVGTDREERTAPTHRAAVELMLEALAARGHALSALDAAAHRIVHGGADLTAPCRITPDVIAAIRALIPIAPLHNPHNLAAVEALLAAAPDLPQYASFDTAFHATMPEVERRYAIPAAEDARGIRRYGFHGLSYASLAARLPGLAGGTLPGRLLAFHLGNGASICAILDGRSVATTMGYSPLEGLTMGTRSGGIDGNAVLRLAEVHGIDGAARLLNRESGLLALGGASDMATLARDGGSGARFAREHFRYWAVRHAGSLIAAMGGLDAVAFTGGIGENDAAMRAGIMAGLAFAGLEADATDNAAGGPALHTPASRVRAWVVPAAEEAWIAAEAQALIATGS